MKLGDIDLSNSDNFVHGIPHDYFSLLRREDPVYWQKSSKNNGFWCITRYDDILEIEKNTRVFSNKTNISPMDAPDTTLDMTVDKMLILSDPPRHGFLRRVVMKGFTPKAISVINERIHELATEALDAVIEKGECDFLDVAAYLPVEVVADLLDVPSKDREKLFHWANALFCISDPDVSDQDGNMIATIDMFIYARKLAKELRKNPTGGVFSGVANAEEDGSRLSYMDLGCFFMLLASAGNETTRTQILQGILTLIQNPEAISQLRENPALMENAVEETLRMNTPLMSMGRLATEDYVLNGKTIKKGDKVIMWYCSGCRDENVFDNPDTFDITRPNANKHIAFGATGSIHRCLGAMLARTELVVIFNQILRRMPDIALAGDVVRLRSNFTHGIKSMPVKFTPGKIEKYPNAKLYSGHAASTSGGSQLAGKLKILAIKLYLLLPSYVQRTLSA